ncbi:MAG TPA: alanine--glyoxylate aminotransferase family protein [Miltoncostaeaceae bacterium]|jgi:aspartate aminotransferase-like enzyme|nr:alanine--glyoxylate aminotransferase family protein [Miltoncostaeaceae bacterium]
MVPGPTALPPEVVAAGVRPILYSRSAEFVAIWEYVIERLRGVFQTEGEILVFGASGSGAMDSAVANLAARGERVLVASCGNFGVRWASICADHGVDALHLEGEWGRPIDPAAVAEALEREPGIEVVFVTQSETSTGVVSDLPALREAAGDRILVADAVSGLGVVDLPMDRWGIDVVVSGSQKGLMTPPGLAFVAAAERAVARSAALGPGGFYLDWERTRKGGSRSPFTPPVTLVCQLQEALRLIEAEGLQDVFARHRALGRMCRAGVQACGLSLLGPENPEANVVTAFLVPEGVDGKAIPAGLKSRFGITIAGGQGKLSGRICRIGHCGYYDYRDILTTLGALEIVLADLGHPVEIGAGVAAAQRVAADALTASSRAL